MTLHDPEIQGLTQHAFKLPSILWSRRLFVVGCALAAWSFLGRGNQKPVLVAQLEVERNPIWIGDTGPVADKSVESFLVESPPHSPQSGLPQVYHFHPLPRLTQEQLMDRRDLYANLHVPVDYKGENLARMEGMRKLFHHGREQYRNALKQHYGEYADIIFELRNASHYTIGASVFQSPGRLSTNKRARSRPPASLLGLQHFVEKMKLKLVQAQLKFLQAEEIPSKTLTRFVHLHGGHSSAAGHGNLHDESYTAVMEKGLRPVLRNIGINYVGRNMAAGATTSAEEVALCSNAYFGYEVDIMSWDYGMLDGKAKWKQELYVRRGALRSRLAPLSDDINDIPSRPAFVGIHYNAHSSFSFSNVEHGNVTVVLLDESTRMRALSQVPDTDLFTKQEERDALPPFLKNFRCGSGFETGESCRPSKYNDTICADRPHQAKWHPGFKMHALEGHLLALGVLDSMEDAMDQLSKLEPTDESKDHAKVRLKQLFHELNNAEQIRYDSFLQDFDADENIWRGYIDNPDTISFVTRNEIVQLPNFCHLSKLPADQRYRGLLTENFELTTINQAIDPTFDRGFPWPKAHEMETGDEQGPTAVSNPKPRQHELVLASSLEWDCPVLTHLDNKDFYYISSMHGWRGLTLPNNAEKQFYSEYDVKNGKGWIIICFGACSWGKCDIDDVQPNNGRKSETAGYLELKINGVMVEGMTDTGDACKFLKHSSVSLDKYNWKPNDDGQYLIEARVVSESFGYTKIASFIFF